MRETKPGSWQLRVGCGKDPITGKYRALNRRVEGNERAARKALARLVLEADARDQPATTASNLSWLLNQHLAHLESLGRSPTTIRGYRSTIRASIEPTLGKRSIDRLTAKDLDQLYVALLSKGRAPATVRQVHAILSGALGLAVRWDLVDRNVATRATPPPVRQAQITPPTAEEIRRLIAAAEEEDPVLGVFAFTAATTGARRGELCALRWSDVDHDRGVITIDEAVRSVPGSRTVGDTKTHSARQLAVDDVTLEVIAAHQVWQLERSDVEMVADPFVFSLRMDGSGPPEPDLFTAAWEKVRVTVGLPHVRLHDLRHFVATQALAAGFDVRTVAGQLGHGGGGAVTLRVYAHVVEERQRALATAMGALVRPSR